MGSLIGPITITKRLKSWEEVNTSYKNSGITSAYILVTFSNYLRIQARHPWLFLHRIRNQIFGYLLFIVWFFLLLFKFIACLLIGLNGGFTKAAAAPPSVIWHAAANRPGRTIWAFNLPSVPAKAMVTQWRNLPYSGNNLRWTSSLPLPLPLAGRRGCEGDMITVRRLGVNVTAVRWWWPTVRCDVSYPR